MIKCYWLVHIFYAHHMISSSLLNLCDLNIDPHKSSLPALLQLCFTPLPLPCNMLTVSMFCENCFDDNKTNMKGKGLNALLGSQRNTLSWSKEENSVWLIRQLSRNKWQIIYCSQRVAVPLKLCSHLIGVSFRPQPGKLNDYTLLKPTVEFFISHYHVISWPSERFFHRACGIENRTQKYIWLTIFSREFLSSWFCMKL